MIKGMIAIIRPIGCALAVVATLIAFRVGSQTFVISRNIILLCVSNFLLMAGAMTINDWFDLEIDKINKPERPIPSGKMSKVQALLYAIALFLAGILFSFVVMWELACYGMLFIIINLVYSSALKKHPVIGNIFIALIMSYPFFSGGYFANGLSKVAVPIGVSIMYILGREILKTAEDVKGDSAAGMNTIAVKIGVRPASFLGSSLMLFALIFAVLQYFFHINNLVYLYPIGAAIIFQTILTIWLMARFSEKNISNTLNLSLVVMLLATMSAIVGLR